MGDGNDYLSGPTTNISQPNDLISKNLNHYKIPLYAKKSKIKAKWMKNLEINIIITSLIPRIGDAHSIEQYDQFQLLSLSHHFQSAYSSEMIA